MDCPEDSPGELAGGQDRDGPFYRNRISDEGLSEQTSPEWRQILGPYGSADLRRSVTQILTSAVPFFVLWYAAYRALSVSYWLTLILAVLTAGFVMRLFLIQHDCGHGSFFKSQKIADLVGFWLGVVTLTPYRYWRKTHAYHHAHSGDLGFRGLGDVDTITVSEYREKPFLGRLRYRLYRNPFVLLGLGRTVRVCLQAPLSLGYSEAMEARMGQRLEDECGAFGDRGAAEPDDWPEGSPPGSPSCTHGDGDRRGVCSFTYSTSSNRRIGTNTPTGRTSTQVSKAVPI